MQGALIGVCGRAGSGKDTAAEHIISKHHYCRVAFADPIKQFSMEVFGFSMNSLWGSSKERSKVDTRYKSYCTVKGPDAAWKLARERYEEFAPTWVDYVAKEHADLAFVREELDTWFHWLGTHHEDSISPRIVLQTLGTEFGRKVLGENGWAELAMTISRTLLSGKDAYGNYVDYAQSEGLYICNEPNPYRGIVISDVRFPNEVSAIRSNGGAVIKLSRESNVAIGGIPGHSSEEALDSLDMSNFGIVIHNNGHKDALYQSIDMFIQISARRQQ